MVKPISLVILVAASAAGQIQNGRVAADFSGSTIGFESAAALAGESEVSGERILESARGGAVGVTAASPLPRFNRGVIGPHTNDSGDLRAYSLYCCAGSSGIGGISPPQYAGVVRHVVDGWEVRYPGRAGLTRDGRWAAFSGSGRTLWVDLWTGAETTLTGIALSVDSMADDGSLVAINGQSLVLHRPGEEPQQWPLPFQASSPVIERYARYASVYGADGLWRVNLANGAVEPWVRQCNNCQVRDIAAAGSSILYRQWSILYIAGEPGSTPKRLSPEGNSVDDASLNGAGTLAVASTPDGIVSYSLDTGTETVLIPGLTSFTREPSVLAPGLWVRQEGRGLATAEIQLNGADVVPLARTSAYIHWVVPQSLRFGLSTLEIGQTASPFAPNSRTKEVQLAAPTFILQADAGIGLPFFYNWPIVYHAATGAPVNAQAPARPGESIDILMTGVNEQGATTEWILSRPNVDVFYYPVFESEAPYTENPNWTVVRLKMPDALPSGLCALGATYRRSAEGVLINTSSSRE